MRLRALVSLVTLVVACGRVDDGGTSSSNGGARSFGGGEPQAGTAGAAPLGGRSAQGGAGSTDATLAEGSWDTTVSLRVTSSNDSLPFACTRAALTMHLSPNGSRLGLIWGGTADVFTGELTQRPSGGPHFAGGGELTLPTRGGDCEATSAELSSITLDGEDLDGDGVVDHLVGAGSAAARAIRGDVAYQVGLSFSLEAVLDRTRPTLLVPSSVHPLDGLSVRASEPLAQTTALSLENSSAPVRVALLAAEPQEGAVGWFSTATILPFGSSWRVRGEGTDLAGFDLELTSASEAHVLADPGVLVEDGFESPPNMAMVGDVETVTGIGTLPAISGARSLLVPPNASVTLHLARPTDRNVVRLTLQRLMAADSAVRGEPPVQVGVAGGTVRASASPTQPRSTATATGDLMWAYAGPKEDLSFMLSENGPQVVVRIAPPPCYGLCPPAQALLVDDLRIE